MAIDVAVEGPDGRGVAVAEGRVRLHQPGIYRLAGGNLLAAAVPGIESDLGQLDPQVLGLERRTTDDALAATSSTPLWPWLLALVAIVLTAELLLAGGLGGRR